MTTSPQQHKPRLRIGIDARFFGGEQSKGLGRYTQKLVEQLFAHDHENEYVIFLQQEAFDAWTHKQPNVTTVLAPYRWYTVAEQIGMLRTIKRAKVDLMHFPHFNVPLFYRAPFIVTIHDLIILRYPTKRASTLGPVFYAFKHWAGKLVMRHAVRASKHIITVSEFSKQDIVDYYGIDPCKLTVTYEAAESPTELRRDGGATIHSDAMLKRYGIQQPYLLYVGNAYPHKNIETLLQVMKQLQERQDTLQQQLVLVGRIDYFYERLKQQAQEMGLTDNVIFTDFVPDNDLPTLYRNATAYIFPSLYEGFGLPPLEAMQYEVPVLASSASCLPEILGDAAEYFKPNDISGIITAIDSVIHNPQKRAQLIVAGNTQLRRYSWEKMMKQTLDIYITHGKPQAE